MTQPETSDSLVAISWGNACPWGDRHLPVVVWSRRIRDRFRRRFWVRCWECQLRLGPFTSAGEADNCRRDVEQRGAGRVALALAGIHYEEVR
jgi:hypothetical protein